LIYFFARIGYSQTNKYQMILIFKSLRIYKIILNILSFLRFKMRRAGRKREGKVRFLLFHTKTRSAQRITKVFLNAKGNFIYLYMLVTIMLFSVKSINAQGIVIVKDHIANASIVISPSASSQIEKVANLLQDAIQKSTGASLPIIKKPQQNTISINVGQTDFVKGRKINLSDLDEDGFLLQKADSHNFIIVGGSDWGTEFGVYSFMERFIGVVNLMPTEIGMDIPLSVSIILPDIKIVDNPVYLSRQISPIYINDNSSLGEWGRFNRLRGRISFSHNLLNLFDPKEYFKTNPNFYPLINNKREIPTGYKWQPDFSTPGIGDSASQKIMRYFKQNPGIPSYSLGINDYSIFDQSPASLLRRKGNKNYLGLEDVSDDYFKWANEVAKKVTAVYPDKKFGLLAYENVAEPPSKSLGVNSHIVPFLTYERMRWSDTSLKNQGHQLTENWAKLCQSLGWYDYTYGLDYLVPRVWFHEMQDYLIWGTKYKVKYYYAELYPNWGEGPKPWIQAKLLWNPHYNVDSLLDIWYVRTAGNQAAPKLKEFYSIWERFWTHDIYSSKWNTDKGQYLNFSNFSYLEAVPQEYISKADELMNLAYQLAGTDLQKQRVSKLLEMWNIYKIAMILYQKSDLPENKRQQALSSSPAFLTLLNNLEKDPLHSLSIQRIKMGLNIK